ncbi:hypothetical protein PAXINDRAFT_158072 [Paxillus involutus ATCC 200175]|uniref:Uncharacterized protein n=1 Tax=Paxillus involutus ATCC 200175 TaxID=664439 RepID=A0A0C9SP54_PAXIN|nr:hypothetical protein PAXINDRAFT_158072 [Paxillus involutus ATCC 200175]
MSDDEAGLYEDERQSLLLDGCEHAEGSQLDQSQYHDGRGIQVSVVFTPLPPRANNGEKRRKNAKIAPTNRVMYYHESNRLCPDNFTAKYTIPRTAYKDVDLTSIKDFDVLIAEVEKQRSPAFKLFLTQTKVLENDSEEDDEEEELPRRKTSKPNSEETKLNEHIAELSRLYTCEDRSCKFPICWPSPTDAKHVHLTPLHLKTWAAAIIATENDPDIQTDYEKPPNTKLFDPAAEMGNPGDVALLSRRRQGTGNAGTSVVVNNDFKELANVLLGRGDRDRRAEPPQQYRDSPEAPCTFHVLLFAV